MKTIITTTLMFSGSLIFIVAYLLYKQDQVNTLTGKIKEKKIKKDKNAKNLEEELNKILMKSAQKVDKSKRLEEGTGVKMGFMDKIQGGVVNTIANPYNQISVVNMFFFVAIFASAGLLSGILLQNAAVAVSGLVLGVITPFSLINLRGMQRQMKMMKGNLSVLMSHYPNYIDSSTFEESLVRTIANIEQNSHQCKCLRICIKNMQENNMPIGNALNILRKQLMADKYVDYYLDGVLKAELEDTQHKDTLSSLLTQFEYLVRQNSALTSFAYAVYVVYIVMLVGMIVVIGILKRSDPVVYKLLAFDIRGQLIIAVIFTIVGLLGFVISKNSGLIQLDLGFTGNSKREEVE